MLRLAEESLYRYLIAHPEKKRDQSWCNEYIEGFTAAMEAIDAATPLVPPNDASDGFKRGYAAVIEMIDASPS